MTLKSRWWWSKGNWNDDYNFVWMQCKCKKVVDSIKPIGEQNESTESTKDTEVLSTPSSVKRSNTLQSKGFTNTAIASKGGQSQ